MPLIATWVDLEIFTLSEVSQTDKYMISQICGIQKNNTNQSVYKTETDSQTQKTNLQSPNVKGGGGAIQGFEINKYKLLYIKQRNNTDLLYNIGNYT